MVKLLLLRASRGFAPFKPAQLPLPPVQLRIVGITRDSSAAPLGSCVVKLFRTVDDIEMDQTISDPVTGEFTFLTVGHISEYYAVAYLEGAPDVAGTTVKHLVGEAF